MSKSPAPFDQGMFLMHLQKGKEFFDHDQLERAREELEAANQLRPHDEKVLNMLGMTYYKLEMLPQAEEMYVILAAGNPEIYALQSNLGLIQLKLNKLEEARDSLNRALELQPTNSKAHFYMGLLYEKKELWEEALYHFEQAKAEKLVAKMQSKMNDQRNESELVLPFDVIEVMSSDSQVSESTLPSIVQEEMATDAAEGIVPEAEVTGTMRTHDLAQAMFQIHDEELVGPPEPSEDPEEAEMDTPITPPTDAGIDIEHASAVAAEPEEAESVIEEESGVELMVERMKEEMQEEPPWEKTPPSIFPERFGEPENTVPDETGLLIGSAIDEPFLLSDEIAADISTFLAESREEENPEEDVFYREPILPEFTILNSADRPDVGIEDAAEPEENRIPTPEEVENEIAESPVESESFEVEPEFTVSHSTESLVPDLEVKFSTEEHVEDLLEEIPSEKLPEIVTPVQQDQEESEDLEVNFAVNESVDDSPVQEGFLQRSYLTPDFEERNLERTQDMTHTPMLRGESLHLQEDISEEFNKPDSDQPILFVQPEQIGTSIEHSPSIETEPAKEDVLEAHHQTEEFARPANLDQFSRDRLYIQPLIGPDRFLLVDPHLLEIIISEKLICRTGTISSYTGNLQFTPWNAEKLDEKSPLIVVSGNGILFLADRRKEIFLISLNNEVIFVESTHLLVAQSGLTIEPQVIQDQSTESSFSVYKVSGRGTLALTCLTKPLTVNVHEGLPANIPARAVIAWSGRVVSEIMNDADLRKVMMSSHQETTFLRLRGTGDVVVEQGGLWGDRRAKRQ